MTSSIAALTAGGGGVATTADASGNLDLKSNTTTILGITATGGTVTGTLNVTGALTVGGATAFQHIKAWVNFDGTAAGTITPRTNYNVSSITKASTGIYTLNFTSAMTDANYCLGGAGASGASGADTLVSFDNSVAPTTTACKINVWAAWNNVVVDSARVTCIIAGN